MKEGRYGCISGAKSRALASAEGDCGGTGDYQNHSITITIDNGERVGFWIYHVYIYILRIL